MIIRHILKIKVVLFSEPFLACSASAFAIRDKMYDLFDKFNLQTFSKYVVGFSEPFLVCSTSAFAIRDKNV
jgi:hypothetical protein